MTEAEVLRVAKLAKDRNISFEVTQRSELRGDVIHWPPELFSIWLQNPRTNIVHRMDDLTQAEAVIDLEAHWRRDWWA
jgi:hypothetical protein